MSLELVTKKGVVSVKSLWIPRWHFLSDIVEELDAKRLEWSYTSFKLLKNWAVLNEHMDAGIRTRHAKLTLSSLKAVVGFMNPVNAEYLIYCYIDEDLSAGERARYYEELGAYIRRRGERLPYSKVPKKYGNLARTVAGYGVGIRVHTPGLYHNFHLFLDPAYGVSPSGTEDGNTIAFDNLGEHVRNFLLDVPILNIATGIMHTAFYLSTSSDRTKRDDDRYLSEIPWYYVPWHDVLRLVPQAVGLLQNSNVNTLVYMLAKGGYSVSEWNSVAREYNDPISRIEDMADHLRGLLYAPRDEPSALVAQLAGERSTSLNGSAQQIELLVGDDGTVSLQIPNAPLFLRRLTTSLSAGVNSGAFTDQDYRSSILFPMTLLYIDSASYVTNKKTSIHANGALGHIISLMARGSRQARVIDSTEYPALCDSIASHLGYSVLELYATVMVELTVPAGPEDIRDLVEAKKAESFCEAAIDSLNGKREEKHFTSWPTIAW